MKNLLLRRAALVAAVILAPTLAVAADNAEMQALREQVRALQAQLTALAQRLDAQTPEAKPAAAAQPAAAAPKITINDASYILASSDAANSIRFRGLMQADLRQFFHDGGIVNNAFVMRRIRVITEGTFAKNFSWQFVPEWGGGTASMHEANVAVALTKSLGVRFGRFKEGIGLERLQSDSWTFMNERSIATNLVPDRDVGVQVFGKAADGRIDYSLGVFNGLPDGATSNSNDYDNDKDLAGRVFASPFKAQAKSPLRGLSFGVGGSIGRQKSTSGRTGGYRTDGQQVFFAYNAATLADGQIWRVAPQLEYRLGSFGLIGEYTVSAANLRPAARTPKTEVRNKAWHLGVGYVLTGEDSTYTGVTPRRDFDWSAGTWGAFEVAARAATVSIDDAAFPLLASAATNANEARSLGAGLNWYLSKAVVFKLDYYRTEFGFNAAAPAVSAAPVLRQDENVFITRFQLSF